jgi:hypothetical protein
MRSCMITLYARKRRKHILSERKDSVRAGGKRPFRRAHTRVQKLNTPQLTGMAKSVVSEKLCKELSVDRAQIDE